MYIHTLVRHTYVSTSVTVGVASSVVTDVTMRVMSYRPWEGGTSRAGHKWHHNENDVTMTIAGLWRYGDWRHVATGCTALVDH